MLSRLFFTPRAKAVAVTELPGNWQQYLGIKSKAGPNVTPATAEGIAAYFDGREQISNAFKGLPVKLYRLLKNGDREEVRDHPSYRALHDRPNPFHLISRLKKQAVVWAIDDGNACSWIEHSNSGKPLHLWPIHPCRVRPIYQQNAARPLLYHVLNSAGQPVTVPPEDMFHIMRFSRDGIWGRGTVATAKESLGLAVAAQDYVGWVFRNNATPGVVVAVKGEMEAPAQDQFKAEWMKSFAGDGAGGMALITGEATVTSLGMKAVESEALAFLEHLGGVEVARWLGMYPHKLRDLRRGTFSNIDTLDRGFYQETIAPYCIDFADEANRKLLTQEERDAGLYFEMDLDAQLRGDPGARATYNRTMFGIGARSINEIRRKDNMNGIGPAGDVYYVPLNMVSAERAARDGGTSGRNGRGNASASMLDRVAATFTTSLAAAIGRMMARELGAGQRAAKSPSTFTSWRESFYARSGDVVRSALGPVIESAGDALALVAGVDPPAAAIRAFVTAAVDRHCSRGSAAMEAGDWSAFDRSKADAHAATELTVLVNTIQR